MPGMPLIDHQKAITQGWIKKSDDWTMLTENFASDLSNKNLVHSYYMCSRCRPAPGGVHHRRHPDAGYGEGLAIPARPQDAPDRAQLPRHHLAGKVQDRHHAGLHP